MIFVIDEAVITVESLDLHLESIYVIDCRPFACLYNDLPVLDKSILME